MNKSTNAASEPNQPVTLSLPSLVHRIGGSSARELKLVATDYNCSLARVRRSRHWQLTGLAVDIDEFIRAVEEIEINNKAYLLNKLRVGLSPYAEQLVPLEAKLETLLRHDPTMTISQLIAMTHCTEPEARRAVLLFDDL